MIDLLPWLIMLPLFWATCAFLFPAYGTGLAFAGTAVQLLLAVALAAQIGAAETAVLHHRVGGWGAPLGIDLFADGLTALMLLLTQLVALPVLVFARSYFAGKSPAFWPLAGFLLAGMNGLFISADLFNLYVTLELVGLAAVGLVAIGGSAQQLAAALRYLFATIVGSGMYLLGVAIIYGTYGTVALETLAPLVAADTPGAVWIAAGLMLCGLMLKTALFPFHYWLPPAHGGSPAPVSALLSALVVKASFYLILRLWTGPFASLVEVAAWLPALMGALAIFWGSWRAIRTAHLKLLVAWSTVAQLGYLFLIFPLLGDDQLALQAGGVQMTAHGLAKAAMFVTVGVLIKVTGHDAVADVAGIAARLPLTLSAFALAGVTLMGLPPSGGFLAKWLLIDAALVRGRWDMVIVILAGGLLAAVYVFRVLRQAFLLPPSAERRHLDRHPVATLEWTAFALAAASILVGLLGMPLVQLVSVGA